MSLEAERAAAAVAGFGTPVVQAAAAGPTGPATAFNPFSAS